MKCSIVDTGVSYTSDSRRPQKKKSKGLRSGERGAQAIDPPCSVHLPGCAAWRCLHPAIEKCAVARSTTFQKNPEDPKFANMVANDAQIGGQPGR
ncbi:hypothetical protein TNCV_4675941 [Trichonephila clavipes]|nr:hypothetical protein TNCV_4675941 [Trichonephila clavipes]